MVHETSLLNSLLISESGQDPILSEGSYKLGFASLSNLLYS